MLSDTRVLPLSAPSKRASAQDMMLICHYFKPRVLVSAAVPPTYSTKYAGDGSPDTPSCGERIQMSNGRWKSQGAPRAWRVAVAT